MWDPTAILPIYPHIDLRDVRHLIDHEGEGKARFEEVRYEGYWYSRQEALFALFVMFPLSLALSLIIGSVIPVMLGILFAGASIAVAFWAWFSDVQ